MRPQPKIISVLAWLFFAIVVGWLLVPPTVEKIIHNYITRNPEIIIGAVEKYRNETAHKIETLRNNQIEQSKPALMASSSPVLGNKNGSKVIIEFFDYQCTFCKSTYAPLEDFKRSDPEVKIVLKNFPILGNGSDIAARASLAAAKTAHFGEFHQALLRAKELNEASIRNIAESVGLQWDALTAAMQDPSIDQELELNKKLAKVLQIKGTPSFIVNNKFLQESIKDKEQLAGLFLS